MKKIVILMLSAILCFGLAACGGDDSEEKAEPAAPVDLAGEWVQTNSSSDSDYMEAIISEDSITVNWVFEDEDSVSLYWAGSYMAPTEPGDEYSWTSENDTTQTDSALLASTAETKDFAYSDGVLSFEASAMGTTMTVEMERAE